MHGSILLDVVSLQPNKTMIDMEKRVADDTMTDMTVKTGKSLLRTCARVRTQERFLRKICHIRHLSFVKGLPRGQ